MEMEERGVEEGREEKRTLMEVGERIGRSGEMESFE